MVKTRGKRPRLINIAVGLTAASVALSLAASHVQQPIDMRGWLYFPEWAYILQGLSYLLPLAAIGSWALLGLGAVVRWSAGFEGY